MSLKKRHAENSTPCCNSGLFGITEKAESADIIRKTEAGFHDDFNYKATRAIRDATLEAEFRKAQSIELLRRYLSHI